MYLSVQPHDTRYCKHCLLEENSDGDLQDQETVPFSCTFFFSESKIDCRTFCEASDFVDKGQDPWGGGGVT